MVLTYREISLALSFFCQICRSQLPTCFLTDLTHPYENPETLQS